MCYVYRFLDKDDNILYVGKTKTSLGNRMGQHFGSNGHLPNECYKQVKAIEYIQTANMAEMDIKEIYYINKWKPPFNTAKKMRDKLYVEIDEFETWCLYEPEIERVKRELNKLQSEKDTLFSEKSEALESIKRLEEENKIMKKENRTIEEELIKLKEKYVPEKPALIGSFKPCPLESIFDENAFIACGDNLAGAMQDLYNRFESIEDNEQRKFWRSNYIYTIKEDEKYYIFPEQYDKDYMGQDCELGFDWSMEKTEDGIRHTKEKIEYVYWNEVTGVLKDVGGNYLLEKDYLYRNRYVYFPTNFSDERRYTHTVFDDIYISHIEVINGILHTTVKMDEWKDLRY